LPLLLSLIALLLAPFGCATGTADETATSPSSSVVSSSSGQGGSTEPGPGGQGGGVAGSGGSGGDGGSGGEASSTLDSLLDALRSDRDAALLAQSQASGWPAPVQGGYLFVSADLPQVAGDHDSWTGKAMQAEADFYWLVLQVPAGSRYKFTDGQSWQADPWSRGYHHDQLGIMSQLPPANEAHLERFFGVTDSNIGARTVRVLLPAVAATHVLYMHDGQNLFDPEAPWGGWQLGQNVPPAMMLVGIDNSSARMDEYTHVQDDLGSPIGGAGDDYADYVELTVRSLIAQHYGEAARVGVMGSSLGGLISFHIAARHPGRYDFAASMSGTMGWGSIGLSNGAQNETMIERYAALGHQTTKLFLDSGGSGTCLDSDNEGIEDDALDGSDNYCENKQLEATLDSAGYVAGQDLWHWHEPNAPHNEAAWAARIFRPLQIFAGL